MDNYLKIALIIIATIIVIAVGNYINKWTKKVKELEERIKKLENIECINEIERQVNKKV